jgi:hypothetical protein
MKPMSTRLLQAVRTLRSKEAGLDRVLHCDCGFEASGPEDDVVAAGQAHAWDAHGMELSAHVARALCRRPNAVLPSKECAGDDRS